MGSSAKEENCLLPLKSGCWAVIKLKLSAAVSPFSPVNVNIQLVGGGEEIESGQRIFLLENILYYGLLYIQAFIIFMILSLVCELELSFCLSSLWR